VIRLCEHRLLRHGKRHGKPAVSERARSEIHAPNPSSRRRHDASTTKRYNAFQVSCNAKITVRKHASTEHTAMNLLKRLWHWYSNRRTERRMLKGHGVYRT